MLSNQIKTVISLHRLNIRKTVVMICIIMQAALLDGQSYRVRHFTVADGLPSSAIQSIFKDSRGLVWIGTEASLCTFDGKKFQIVKTQEGKTIDRVWSITEDDKGHVWFGSYQDGIFVYNGLGFNRITAKDGLTDNNVRVIRYSKKFNLIAACTYSGVSIIGNDTIIRSPAWMGNMQNSLTSDGIIEADNFLYITTIDWMNPIRYYPANKQFIKLDESKKPIAGPVLCAFVSSKGDTLLSRYVMGLTIITDKGVIQEPSIGQVFNVDEDRDGNLWLASWSFHNRDLREGIFRWDGHEFVNMQSTFGITDKEIWTVMCDREQDLVWVGTINDGLYLAMKDEIHRFGLDYFGLDQLKINDLYIDVNNTLWIAGKQELIRIKPDGTFSFVQKRPMVQAFQKHWKQSSRTYICPIDSVHRTLRSIKGVRLDRFEKENPFDFQQVLEGPDNTLFFTNRFGLFSLYDNGINYYCPEGSEGSFGFIGNDTLILAGSGPTLLNTRFRDPTATIIAQPIDVIPIKKLFYPFTAFNSDWNPYGTHSLVRQGQHHWFASGSSGLWMSEGFNLIHLSGKDSTISKNLKDVCFDPAGNVIFGSNQGEICIASYENDRLTIKYRINEDQGLRGNTIDWLVAGNNGWLWAGTNLGLNGIDLNSLYKSDTCRIRFFDQEDGYTGRGSIRAAIDQNDRLFIAGEDELIRIDTRKLLTGTSSQPVIRLLSVQVNQEPLPDTILWYTKNQGLNQSKHIKFKHFQRNLVFNFDVLNYSNPGKDLFRYKLDRFDKDWSKWDKARQANYTSLPSGKYQFMVESINLQSLKKTEPLVFGFTIPKPFWMESYFVILCTLLILTGVVFITRFQLDRKRARQMREADVERKILKLEMQALQAQMNPHFIYNSISGIQYYILDSKMDEVMEYLADFSRVVRFSMENALNTSIPVEKEIEFLNSYLRLEQMRFQDLFSYEIIKADGHDWNSIRIPSMMVQPFAENSITHGFRNSSQKGILTIEFELLAEDIVRCRIIDNGIGREQAAGYSTHQNRMDRLHSTNITQMRLELFNKKGAAKKYRIEYFDHPDQTLKSGLTVSLYMPVQNR